MKDKQRYIMVRKPLKFNLYIPKCCVVTLRKHVFTAINLFVNACVYFLNSWYLTWDKTLKDLLYTGIIILSVLVPTLYRVAYFLHTPALCQTLSALPPPPSSCVCPCPLVCKRRWGCLSGFLQCVCVIIARPPRGNQQWSLHSPDPLMPQHTCPWGAVPLSSEPLWVCLCGCTICPQLGGIGVGMLHHRLVIRTYKHTYTH